MKLETVQEKVAWLLEHVPSAKQDYILLTLLYWQMFDGINISGSMINQIMTKGTKIESICRSKRKLLECNIDSDSLIKEINRIIKENAIA